MIMVFGIFRFALSMNQKNLNYEIKTPLLLWAYPTRLVSMNQKNLNYEIETRISWQLRKK